MLRFFEVKSSLIFIAALPFLSSQGSPLSPMECIIDKSGQTRMFSSLAEYQSTKESFDVNQQGYKGNIVAFNKPIIKIEQNSFVSFGSESIIELRLDHKTISILDVGAFLGLYCLQILDLSYNNISNISEGVFQGLPNLVKLDLSNNVLETIPDTGLALYALRSIKILDLSNNRIKILPRLSFEPLTNMEVLNLSFNKIKYIESSVFNSLSNLKLLFLNNNYLSSITPEEWAHLDNLTTLQLSNNYLTSFDTSYNFSFESLHTLNLSGNYLTSLNALAMRKSLPKLGELDISNNRWFCGDLELLKHFLQDSSVAITDVGCMEIRNTWTPPRVIDDETTTTTSTFRPTARSNCVNDTSSNISEQLEELKSASNLLNNSLKHVESVVIVLFLFVILVLLLDIVIRVGGCRVLTRRCSSEERDFLDSGNIENMTLLRR